VTARELAAERLAVQLDRAQRNDRLVSGDLHMAQGRHNLGELDHLEAAIGAKIVRGPGDRGYNPMMARIMASLGRVAS
jgi:hypothetical protein